MIHFFSDEDTQVLLQGNRVSPCMPHHINRGEIALLGLAYEPKGGSLFVNKT